MNFPIFLAGSIPQWLICVDCLANKLPHNPIKCTSRPLLPMQHVFQQMHSITYTFSALTLSVARQEGHPACKKTEWWGAGVVICLERGAGLHIAQLMPLPLNVSCFSKVQIGFTFLVPAHPGSPGKGPPLKVCVRVIQHTLFTDPPISNLLTSNNLWLSIIWSQKSHN